MITTTACTSFMSRVRSNLYGKKWFFDWTCYNGPQKEVNNIELLQPYTIIILKLSITLW